MAAATGKVTAAERRLGRSEPQPHRPAAQTEVRAGDDLLLGVPAAGLLIQMDGGPPNASDRLVIEDQGMGNTIRQHQAPDERSGSVHVGALPPVSYTGIEFVDIVPLDPVTGGAGSQIQTFSPDAPASQYGL